MGILSEVCPRQSAVMVVAVVMQRSFRGFPVLMFDVVMIPIPEVTVPVILVLTVPITEAIVPGNLFTVPIPEVAIFHVLILAVVCPFFPESRFSVRDLVFRQGRAVVTIPIRQ